MAHGRVKPCPRLGLGDHLHSDPGWRGNRGECVGWGSRVSSEAGAAGQAQANGYRVGFRSDGPGDGRSWGGRSWGGRSRGGRPRGGRPWVLGLGPNRLRSFSPLRVGHLEAAVWVAYYQRQWGRFLALSVLVVRTAFGMDWIRTVHGAW